MLAARKLVLRSAATAGCLQRWSTACRRQGQGGGKPNIGLAYLGALPAPFPPPSARWLSLSSGTFPELGLSEEVLAGLQGIATPTEVQAAGIPAILSGQDTIVSSETGSGKTLTYLLPLAQRLAQAGLVGQVPPGTDPFALVLVPTQELVLQLQQVIATHFPGTLAPATRVAHGTVGPGRSAPCSLLLATPQALATNLPPRRLKRLQVLVLDEADMLLSGDFLPLVRDSLLMGGRRGGGSGPPLQQHIFVAATLPDTGKKGTAAFLRQFFRSAQTVATAGRHRPPPSVQHRSVVVGDWAAWGRMGEAEDAVRALASAVAVGAQGPVDTAPRVAEDGSLVQPHFVADAGHLLAVDDVVTPGRPAVDAAPLPADGIPPSQGLASLYHAAQDAKARYEAHLFSERCSALLSVLLGGAGGGPALHPMPEDGVPTGGDAALAAASRHAQLHLPAWPFTEAEGEGGGGVRATRPVPPLPPADTPLDLPPTIVFCASSRTVGRVVSFLRSVAPGLSVEGVHSKVPSATRATRLAAFAGGTCRVLVATDLAARGLDTVNAQHIVQFDTASDAVSYLHRVGRVGRVGGAAAGRVTHLLTPHNAQLAADIAAAQAAGEDLEGVFSRGRSLRRKRRKAAAKGTAAGGADTVR